MLATNKRLKVLSKTKKKEEKEREKWERREILILGGRQ
jgi:hypothetical protein